MRIGGDLLVRGINRSELVKDAIEEAFMTRTVLGFDASCSNCREIAHQISVISEGKLEVLSLRSPEVQVWRQEAFGDSPPLDTHIIRVG